MLPGGSLESVESDLRRLCALVVAAVAPEGLAGAARSLLLGNIASWPRDRWSVLVPLAQSQGLTPILYDTLRGLQALELVPQPAREALQAGYLQLAGNSVLAQREITRWAARFAESGITAIWLKGTPLSLSVYPAPELRPMNDLDVLVAPADLPRTLALLESETGMAPATLGGQIEQHARAQLGVRGEIKMELHWDLFAPLKGVQTGLEWFLDQRTVLPTAIGPLTTFRPDAQLLYLCAHAEIAHGSEPLYLLRYLDLHLLITRAAELDWYLIVERAVALGWMGALWRALSTAQEYFSTRLPEGLLPALGDRVAGTPLQDITLPSSDNRWERMSFHLQSLTWANRIRLVRHLIFPAISYMRWRYRIRQPWLLPLYYPYRWLDMAREIARSLVRRGPSTSR